MYFWEAQETLTILQWIFRSTVVFLWLFLMTKLMGQRLIGRLTLFDFIVAITIGSVAASTLSNSNANLISIIIILLVFALLDVLFAYLALKFSKLRRVVQDEPLVLVKNGDVLEDTMRKTRINLDDLLMSIRQKNVPNLADVEFAILEPNGKVSVIPKSQSRPVTPGDLNVGTKYEGLPTVLVEDGNILQDNLIENNLDEKWLKEQMNSQGIDNINQIQVAILDTLGELYISKKE